MLIKDYEITGGLSAGVIRAPEYLEATIHPNERERLKAENLVAGWYNWRQGPQVNPAIQTTVQYDRFYWGDFQDDLGNVSFGRHEAWWRTRKPKAFRIRCVVEGVMGRKFPSFVPSVTLASGEVVPDWNHPDFIVTLNSFLLRFSTMLANEGIPLAWVDMGVYGNYGEWHLFGLPGAPAANEATKQAILDAHIQNFASMAELKLMSDAGVEWLRYANTKVGASPTSVSPFVGWRRDSLGTDHFDRIDTDRYWREISSQTACVAELGTKSPKLVDALEQIEHYHITWIGNGNYKSWDRMSDLEREAWNALGHAAQRMHRMSSFWLAGGKTNQAGVPTLLKANLHDNDSIRPTAPVYFELAINTPPFTKAVKIGTKLRQKLAALNLGDTPFREPILHLKGYWLHNGDIRLLSCDGSLQGLTDEYPLVFGSLAVRAYSPHAEMFGHWSFQATLACTADDYTVIVARLRDQIKTLTAEIEHLNTSRSEADKKMAQELYNMAVLLDSSIGDW